MKQQTYFITGISTEVGKTIASAIVTEALKADYWKPIQAGELENCDTKKVNRLISNSKSKFHDNSYALQTPMSPHAAAAIDKITIDLKQIKKPRTKNHLVIEGAGGLLVPLNNTHTILDIITGTRVVNYKTAAFLRFSAVDCCALWCFVCMYMWYTHCSPCFFFLGWLNPASRCWERSIITTNC